MSTLVFVYGTLMRGGRYHSLLRTARFVGSARTTCDYELVDLGEYPALVEAGTTAVAVAGELYAVDAETLEALDQLEGHPGYYRRRLIVLDGGQNALTYVMDAAETAERPRIRSGDWRQHRS